MRRAIFGLVTLLSALAVAGGLTLFLPDADATVAPAAPHGSSTVDTDLIPSIGGGTLFLGSESKEWGVWAQDVFAHGSVTAGDAVYPLFDTEWPGDAHELGKRNVPVAWARVAGSQLSGPHYNVKTVAHPATGKYRVTLDAGVATALVPLVTVYGTGQPRFVNAMPVNGSTFDVYVRNERGQTTDCDLGFVVFGF